MSDPRFDRLAHLLATRPLSARARFSPTEGEIVALALDSGGPNESAPPEIGLNSALTTA